MVLRSSRANLSTATENAKHTRHLFVAAAPARKRSRPMGIVDIHNSRLPENKETASPVAARSEKNPQSTQRVRDVISAEYLGEVPAGPPAESLKVRVPEADCGIVPAEANTGTPRRGDFERMARRRFQDPKPFRRGGGGVFSTGGTISAKAIPSARRPGQNWRPRPCQSGK